MIKFDLPTTFDKRPILCSNCQSPIDYRVINTRFWLATTEVWYVTFKCKCGKTVPFHIGKTELETIESTLSLFGKDLNKHKSVSGTMRECEYPKILSIWYTDFAKFLNKPVYIEDWQEGVHFEVTSSANCDIKLEGKYKKLPLFRQHDIMKIIENYPDVFFRDLENGYKYVGVISETWNKKPDVCLIDMMKDGEIIPQKDMHKIRSCTEYSFKTVAELFTRIDIDIEGLFLGKGIILKTDDNVMAKVDVNTLRYIIHGMAQPKETKSNHDKLHDILYIIYENDPTSFLKPTEAMPLFMAAALHEIKPLPRNLQMYYYGYVLELFIDGKITKPLGAK